MKVGILTFSAAYNFGAVLQCYALYKTLQNMGHDIEVIDYRPTYLTLIKKDNIVIKILKNVYNTIFRTDKAIRDQVYRLYKEFEESNLSLSPRTEIINDLIRVIQNRKYDYIIVGSDQVWNPKFNGNDNAWYGLPDESKTKWITYAASAGNHNFTNEEQLYLGKIIKNFTSLSVREQYLKIILQNLNPNIGDIAVTVDPTLLAPTNIWDKWRGPILNKEYILIYQARETNEIFRIARDLSMQLNNIDIVPIDLYPNVTDNGFTSFIASPSDFISLIYNAKCVVTTSFHGTVFSILSKTPFYTLRLNDGADGRSEELLNLLGLSDRMIPCTETPTFATLDFSKAHGLIEEYRTQSLNFLRRALV